MHVSIPYGIEICIRVSDHPGQAVGERQNASSLSELNCQALLEKDRTVCALAGSN